MKEDSVRGWRGYRPTLRYNNKVECLVCEGKRFHVIYVDHARKRTKAEQSASVEELVTNLQMLKTKVRSA